MSEPPGWVEVVERLRGGVIEPLKRRFVGRDEVVDLIALAAVAGEHLFLHGPPGTAKSALIRHFAAAVDGRYFEHLLTRFSEPNELFGPIDLARLREGTVATVTTGMLPEAEFVFLDELFNSNSAILNNLLTVLNERVYRRGAESHRLPLISLFSASNQLAEEVGLRALFDRFLLRCHVEHLGGADLPALLAAGWALERPSNEPPAITSDELRGLGTRVLDVELADVMESHAELVGKLRDLGVALTDRRAVKMLKLVAASAVLCGRSSATAADLWVLRYVWDREEQIGPVGTLVDATLQRCAEADEARHPLSRPSTQVDPEALACELAELGRTLESAAPSLSALARMRERLAELSDRSAWVAEEETRRVLLQRVARLRERLS